MTSFEDDFCLNDLMNEQKQQEFLELVSALGGQQFYLAPDRTAESESIEFNLNEIAWMRGGEKSGRHAAARLMEFALYFAGKYKLAANLHRDVTHDNFEELARQNEALRQSEERLVALSSELQRRVDKQVLLIDKAQRELYETARLRSVGQLAAGVAHEINNPISFVISNLRIAQEYIGELRGVVSVGPSVELLDDFQSLIEESIGGANRISSIVRDIRTFSNIDRDEFVVCDVNALIASACHLADTERKHSYQINLDFGDLPAYHGYPAKLSQAFYNILDNAIKASQPGGVIDICSTCTADFIEVSVRDNGEGMTSDVLSRIFDPFFTTRDVGEGTGLGLTVTRDIVRAHGGEISVFSEPGQGSAVTMTLMRRKTGAI